MAMAIEPFVFLAILPSLLICAFVIAHLYHVRKHDVVLYRFCQIRRDMMRLLRERGFELNERDYRAMRVYLRTLNRLIAGYSHNKRGVFNFRRFLAWIDRNEKLLDRTSFAEAENAEIRELQERMVKTKGPPK